MPTSTASSASRLVRTRRRDPLPTSPSAPLHITAIHPEYPNMYPYRPYVVVANRVGLLVHFDTDACHGVPFVLVRELHHHPEAEAPEGEMMTLTATAERPPPRDDSVGNILSISLAAHVSFDTDDIIIAELVVTTGSECASIIYCFAAEPSSGSSWFEEYVDCPLVDHDRSWVPSGVVFHDDRHWWFDLSWGLLSCNADPDEFMVLLFHDLPEGRALDASQLNGAASRREGTLYGTWRSWLRAKRQRRCPCGGRSPFTTTTATTTLCGKWCTR
jgi:hypothetical protein